MTELASPRAARLNPPRWLDARLVLGVLLVLLAVVVGARVFATADRFSEVLVAKHPLVPGEHLTSADFGAGRVRFAGQGTHYLAATGAPPSGYVVMHYVGANEFVPVGALSPAVNAPPSRYVTVPVQPGHLPSDLGRGQLVDVYVTPKAAAGAAVPDPVLVLAGVPVQSRQGGSQSFAGSSALAVVLAVPAERVAAVVRAVESGAIDLVAVPAAGSGS